MSDRTWARSIDSMTLLIGKAAGEDRRGMLAKMDPLAPALALACAAGPRGPCLREPGGPPRPGGRPAADQAPPVAPPPAPPGQADPPLADDAAPASADRCGFPCCDNDDV